jgi:hypothetical protein
VAHQCAKVRSRQANKERASRTTRAEQELTRQNKISQSLQASTVASCRDSRHNVAGHMRHHLKQHTGSTSHAVLKSSSSAKEADTACSIGSRVRNFTAKCHIDNSLSNRHRAKQPERSQLQVAIISSTANE